MTTPFDLPGVIKCPSCGRTNGTPTRGGAFDCMFCGARISLPAAPSSSSFSTPTPAAPVSHGTPPQTPVRPAAAPRPQWPPLEPSVSAQPPARTPPSPAAIPPAGGTFSTRGTFDPSSPVLASYRWYSGRAIFDVVVSAVTAAFFLFIFYMALPSRDFSQIPWLFVLFAATFLFSSLSSVYRGLARIFNTTSLRLESGVLSARHGPIPWGGARVDVEDIERIGVDQQRVQQNRRSSTVRYNLTAYRKDGHKIVLVPGLNSPADGEALVESLNLRMGLGR